MEGAFFIMKIFIGISIAFIKIWYIEKAFSDLNVHRQLTKRERRPTH